MNEQKNDPIGSARNLIQIPTIPITEISPPNPIPIIESNENFGEINGKNCFQQIFFSWAYNLLSRCGQGNMKIQSTPPLPSHLRAEHQFENYLKNKKQLTEMGALRMVLKQYGGQLCFLVFLCFIVEVFYLSYPIVIYYCVDYIENRRSDTRQGIILFTITILVSFFYNLTYRNLKYRFKGLGVNLSTHFNLLIYHKSLNYSFIADNRFSEGDVISLSQIDTDNLMYVGSKLAYFIFGTFDIFFGFGLLYWFIGVPFVTGLVILIVVSAITFLVSLYGIKVTQKALESRDERISATQQVLKIIRFIKLNAMQKFYYNKIQQKREEELSNFRKKGIVQIALIFLYYLTAPLVLTGIIVTYILVNGDITPAKVFTTMMISVVFQVTAQALPKAISELLAVVKSLERITEFLQAPEISIDHYQKRQNSEESLCICIKEGNFFLYSNKQRQQGNSKVQPQNFNPQNIKTQSQAKQSLFNHAKQFISPQQLSSQRNLKRKDSQSALNNDEVLLLKDINLNIKKGKINMIFGDIGSGKSMLLLSILNQLKSKQNTSVEVNGKLAFVSQKPWIFSGTLLSNITFTFQKQQSLLQQVINYSCLAADLEQMPNEINTQIGQNGINLSGGQKFRVDFARSLYSKSDIYLYDDILSAVDIHVGTFIMQQTIKKYLAGKTVILATHAIKYAERADNIILMKNGEIIASGCFSDISNTHQFSQLKAKIVARQNELQKSVLQKSVKVILSQALQQSQIMSNQQQRQLQIVDQIVGEVQQQNLAIVEDLIIPEDQEDGRVNFKIFIQYIKLNGGYCMFLFPIILCFLIYSGLQTTASIILSKWSQGHGENRTLLYIFIALTISANLFIFIQSIILLLSGVRQGRVVHSNIFKRLLYASLNNFYNRVPLGRLLNRLGKDLKQIDESISNTLSSSLLTFFRTISALVISIYASTFFALIPIAICTFLFWKIRNFYLQGQTQLIRLQKITNTPLIISFTTGIRGAVPIRSYGSCQKYLKEHIRIVNDFKRVQYNRFAIEGWFILALVGLLYIVNMFTVGFSMFSPTTNPSSLGLLLIYVLNLNDELFQFVLDQAQFQTELVSLERIYSLMQLTPEKKYAQYCEKWQEKQQFLKKQITMGQIQFKQVIARYRPDLPSVLKGVTCKISAGEKIGIVGRTGSGKTTLLNTIICLTQLSGGSILIDKKNINTIPIKNLRKEITVIDQQPVLMNSTFRENLDVFNQYTDDELLRVMEQCNISEIIQKRGGLSGEVSNDSLSAGQKQLLSICRALLKNTQIVLIDEATANVDGKNDSLIQSVLEKNFVGKTILTIAHRLSTLEKYDKIMVMDSGRLIQFGTPKELINKRGIYYQMIKKYETSQNGINQMLK